MTCPCWIQSIPLLSTMLCRHPVQQYAATELIAERGCQKYHPRRRRVREIRTCRKPGRFQQVRATVPLLRRSFLRCVSCCLLDRVQVQGLFASGGGIGLHWVAAQYCTQHRRTKRQYLQLRKSLKIMVLYRAQRREISVVRYSNIIFKDVLSSR